MCSGLNCDFIFVKVIFGVFKIMEGYNFVMWMLEVFNVEEEM